MDIKKFAAEVHEIALDHGFWDDKKAIDRIPEALCLIHSEISEALEDSRKPGFNPVTITFVRDGKPEGFGIELADAIIRILDLSEALGINIEQALYLKAVYNQERPYKHGKRF